MSVTAVGGTAPTVSDPRSIRNIALVGHSGAGKTTLVEALLAATGTIQRAGSVGDGTTVSDFDPAEHRQQRSISLSLAPMQHEGIKVNLLDTPGYPDFVGDLRAGLRAADAALFVIAATDGIDGVTRLLWEECTAVGMPRAVVVTKLDAPRADYDEALFAAQNAFGDGVMPLYLPMLADDDSVAGLIALLSQRVNDYSSGARVEREAEPQHMEMIEPARVELLEGIIAESEDETLMDRYLDGEVIDTTTLVDDLEKAVARGSFFPVIPVSASTGLGVGELLEVLTRGFPSPLEHAFPPVATPDGAPRGPLTADPDGPLVAEVVKTVSDPYVGRVSLVRVFSGTLRPDMVVHVSGHGLADRGHPDHDLDERIGALSSPLGRTQRRLAKAVAGDICTVAKLSHAETGDTLSDKSRPLLMQPWQMPDPLLPIAIVARSNADEDKLSQGLARLVAEDPTMRLEQSRETGQVVLWTLGEAHVDVLLDRLAHRYGVSVDTVPLRVALRETFATSSKGHGRHVKQSGGHGQFAVCDIEIEPLPQGSGFQFVDKVVGGSVPRQFIPSVEKGILAQLAKGVGAGYPMVDVRVTVVDGKAHSVDSSDMAFQMAGGLALRDAAERAQILLLEPIDEVAVLIDDEVVGAVMGDISARRGHVVGTEPISGPIGGSGRTVVRAEVPQLEITRYAIDLRSMSHGTGSFTRTYSRHDPMPPAMSAKVLAESAH